MSGLQATLPGMEEFANLKKKGSKSTYYLCISGLQKAIRRGNVEVALRLAKIAWNFDAFKCWRRCFTILLEDVASIPSIYQWVAENVKSSKDWDIIAEFVELMALSPKSREIGAFAYPVKNNYPIVEEYPIDMKNLLLRGVGEGRFDVYDTTYPEWSVKFAEVCYKNRDWEHFSIYLPYLLKKCPYDELVATGDVTLHPIVDELWEGIPLTAFDEHTSQGKRFLSIYWRKNKEKLEGLGFDGERQFFDSWWSTFGATCKNVAPTIIADKYPGNVAESCGNVCKFVKKDAILTVVDDMRGFLLWFLNSNKSIFLEGF